MKPGNFTKQMLNGIRVSSKEELESRIYQYFNEINEVPVPYHWSYKLDDIDLDKKLLFEFHRQFSFSSRIWGQFIDCSINSDIAD